MIEIYEYNLQIKFMFAQDIIRNFYLLFTGVWQAIFW